MVSIIRASQEYEGSAWAAYDTVFRRQAAATGHHLMLCHGGRRPGHGKKGEGGQIGGGGGGGILVGGPGQTRLVGCLTPAISVIASTRTYAGQPFRCGQPRWGMTRARTGPIWRGGPRDPILVGEQTGTMPKADLYRGRDKLRILQ